MSHPWNPIHRWSIVGFFILITSVLFVVLDSQVRLFKEEKPIHWSAEEINLLKSLVLDGENYSLPNEYSNQWADDEAAALFGQKLFFDEQLSFTGEVACSSCHQPDKYFTDGQNLPTFKNKTGDRNTPTVVGAAVSQWQFWDGRADSLWSQALGPLENVKEHGNNRLNVAKFIQENYVEAYENIFGQVPNLDDIDLRHASPLSVDPTLRKNWDNLTERQKRNVNRVFVNIGKAISAYERKLLPAPSRFDYFVESLSQSHSGNQHKWLSREEQRGLKLFISEDGGRCTQCHNGPYFTNSDFQAIAVPPIPSKGGDLGRLDGVKKFASTEFHCLSEYSDADPEKGDCDESIYRKQTGIELSGAFKVPSLRNVSKTAPYMHGGQLKNLKEVLHYYNRAPVELGAHSEIMPMTLLPRELKMIEAFLKSLDSEIAAEPQWLEAPKAARPLRISSVFNRFGLD